MRSLSLIVLCFLLSGQAWAKPAALVTDLAGEVQISGKKLKLLDSVESQTKIRLAKKSRLTLNHLAKGAQYKAKGPLLIEVGAKGIRVLQGDKSSLTRSGGRQTSSRTPGKQVSLSIGAEYHRGQNFMLLPVGATLESRPHFQWTAHQAAEMYRVELWSDSKLLFSETTDEVEMAYPESEAALEDGKEYELRLYALVEDDLENYETVEAVAARLRYEPDSELEADIQYGLDAWKKGGADRSQLVCLLGYCLNRQLYRKSVVILEALLTKSDDALENLNARVNQDITKQLRSL